MRNSNLQALLTTLLGEQKTDALFATLNLPPLLEDWKPARSRAPSWRRR